MRDYERESFTLQGWEIEMLAAECRKDPSADIWVIFRRGDRRVIGRPIDRQHGDGWDSPRHITRTNQSALGRGAISRKTGDRAGPCAGPSALS